MSDRKLLPIPKFPYYLAGDDGTIWSIRRKGGNNRESGQTQAPRQMKTNADRNGYMLVSLQKDSRVATSYVHLLVLETFVGPHPKGMEGCHFPDSNRSNNRLDNLRWDTHQENMRDRSRDRIGNGERRCTRCEKMKPCVLFYVNKNSVDGRHSRCKECHKAMSSVYRKQRKSKLQQ